MKKGLFGFNVHDIVEIAIMCALAIILDKFLKIPVSSSAGSINLSMLPILILTLRHGWFKGFFAGGIVYGLITCLWDGYGFMTYPFDYFLGFGSVALIGLFSKYIALNYGKSGKQTTLCYVYTIIGVTLWGIVRCFASSLSSVLIYEYEWGAAIAYNIPYVFVSALADAIILCLILYVINRLNKSFKTSYLKSLINQ